MQDVFCVSIPDSTDEYFDEFQKAMDLIHDSFMRYAHSLAQELHVSVRCAEDVLYLRGRSRWTQDLEDELIRRDKAGEPAPNICEFGT